MRALLIFSLLTVASAAHAQTQSYVVLPNIAAAQARSAAQCAALGCTGGTKYWWQVQPLTDGTAALRVEATGPFSESTTVGGHAAGLNAAEHSAKVGYGAMSTKLPWVVSEPAFAARFTAAQISSLNAATGQCAADWTAVKAAATVDLAVAGVRLANDCVAQGLAFNWQALLAPVAVAAVPQ